MARRSLLRPQPPDSPVGFSHVFFAESLEVRVLSGIFERSGCTANLHSGLARLDREGSLGLLQFWIGLAFFVGRLRFVPFIKCLTGCLEHLAEAGRYVFDDS